MLMADPRQQLERIGNGLNIPVIDNGNTGIEQFAGNFLDPNLRHSYFDVSALELDLNLPTLTREAYLWLRSLATGQTRTDAPEFWKAWESNCKAVHGLVVDAVYRISSSRCRSPELQWRFAEYIAMSDLLKALSNRYRWPSVLW